MISVQNLVKKYGIDTILKNLNFEVKTGEIVGFLGPNGAGKSTTMRILAGLTLPTSGKVIIGDKDITRHPELAKAMIGYLPENPGLYKDMRVISYLRFYGKLYNLKGKSLENRIEELLEKFDLKTERKSIIKKLSRGYLQRIALAKTFLHDPQILLLDEPTTGLDPAQSLVFRNFLLSISRKKAILMSTHILPEAQKLCDRIYLIHHGEIVAERKIKEEANYQYSSWFLKVARPSHHLFDSLQAMEGVKNVQILKDIKGAYYLELKNGNEFLERLTSFIINGGYGLLQINPYQDELEKIFQNLNFLN